jgi:amylosucrase
LIDWNKNQKAKQSGTVEHGVYSATKKLIKLRSTLPAVADHKNLEWVKTEDQRIAIFNRFTTNQNLTFIFNFSNDVVALSSNSLLNTNQKRNKLFDHWAGKQISPGDSIMIQPYEFLILETK